MGVGAACARLFAARGANLVLAARGEARLQEIAAELSEVTEVLAVPTDVGDVTACQSLLEQGDKHFGGFHVLINNAGMHVRGNIAEAAADQLGAMVDVNLRAPIVLSALAAPIILRSGGGAIVMVGSLAGRTPMQGAATYGATKAGLRSLSYAFGDEIRDAGVHVGLVSPGPIDTGFIMDEIDDVEDIVFAQPMSTADQVAEAILQVANGEQDEICLPANGGRLTTLSYLFPWLRRKARPRLYAVGRKNKEKYRKR